MPSKSFKVTITHGAKTDTVITINAMSCGMDEIVLYRGIIKTTVGGLEEAIRRCLSSGLLLKSIRDKKNNYK